MNACTVSGCTNTPEFTERINANIYVWCSAHWSSIRPGLEGDWWRRRVANPPKPRNRATVKTQCVWCGTDLDATTVTREHVIPESKGGKGGMNLAPACEPCNMRKGDLTAAQFLQVLHRRRV